MATHSPSRRAYWLLPSINPRRASLRYRCLDPMGEMRRHGRDIGFFDPATSVLDAGTTLLLDAWTLFPSVAPAARSDALLDIAAQARQAGARIVVDNCDNQFAAATPPEHWDQGLARLARLAAMADVMVCCSDALSQALRQHLGEGPRHVVIDDPIEERIHYPGDTRLRAWLSPARKLAAWRVLQLRARLLAGRMKGQLPLLWFGSQGNNFSPGGMLDLLALKPVLEDIHRQRPLSLTVISNHQRKFNEHIAGWSLPTHYLEWDRANFLQALRLHAVSLIPVTDNAFTRCKSSNRLTLSLHHGLQVIADDVPSYRSFRPVAHVGAMEEGLRQLLLQGRPPADPQAIRQSPLLRSRRLPAIAAQWDALIFGAADPLQSC